TPLYYQGDDEYYYALMARLVLWAAGKESGTKTEIAEEQFDLAAGAEIPRIACTISLPPQSTEQVGHVDFVVRDSSVGWGFKEPIGPEGRYNVRQLGRWSYPEIHRE